MSLFLFKKAAVKNAAINKAIHELMVIQNNGSAKEAYLVDTSKNTYTPKASPTFAAGVMYARYSPDGKFLAVVYNAAPWVGLFYREADGSYTARTMGAQATYITSQLATQGVSFTADSRFLAIALKNEVSVTLFELGQDKLNYNYHSKTVWATAVGNTWASAISPDGNYFVVGNSYENNRMRMFKWNGTAFAYLGNVQMGSADIPYAEQFAWTKDSRHLFAVTGLSTNSLLAFRRDGDAFTRTIALSISNGPRNLEISPENNHVAVAGGNYTGNLVQIYKWNGATGMQELSLSLPAFVTASVSYSSDGAYMVLGHTSSGQNVQETRVFSRSGDSYNLVANGTAATNNITTALAYFRPVSSS